MNYYKEDDTCWYILDGPSVYQVTPERKALVLDETGVYAVQYAVALLFDLPEYSGADVPVWVRRSMDQDMDKAMEQWCLDEEAAIASWDNSHEYRGEE